MSSLTPDELAVMKTLVDSLIAEANTALVASTEDALPVDLESPIGRLSRMDAIQQQQMASARRRSTEVRLKALHGARARLERGEYGDCITCDEPIGLARLQVKPEAILCMTCQRQTGR